IAEVLDGRKKPPPIPYISNNKLIVTGFNIYCNNPRLVYATIIIISPVVINTILPMREINLPDIFEVSTNPKGEVRLTNPICQDER
ncbi:hypothetical protein RLF91_11400, partial [Streptococcus pneumoniae]|nr:hypothetical protein [Streptococcus pneumoniae]